MSLMLWNLWPCNSYFAIISFKALPTWRETIEVTERYGNTSTGGLFRECLDKENKMRARDTWVSSYKRSNPLGDSKRISSLVHALEKFTHQPG